MFYFTGTEMINLNEIKIAKVCKVLSGRSSVPAIQIQFKDGSHMNILCDTETSAKETVSEMFSKISK